MNNIDQQIDEISDPTARAVIKLKGRFDNTEGCTVRIVSNGHGDFFVCVRPSRSRREYKWLLSDVARGVILKAAQAGTVS